MYPNYYAKNLSKRNRGFRSGTIMRLFIIALAAIQFAAASPKKKKKTKAKEDKIEASILSGLRFRSIGPAFTSGRVIDLAVNPEKNSEYYVAVASGGVWKTTNSGTTYDPIFDGEASYSIACVQLAPTNPHVVWVGTGENNNQRSVAYGDGVYKSEDGGKSWKNMGLKNSEHIGKILIHPENENIVYVAAYGPLWSKGGERGLYKTIDGGENWELILEIDGHTGINDIVMDPRNPDIIYAAAHQRRRHVFTYLGGGKGSGIHKTTDGGKNWKKLSHGLPSSEMGRIGLAVSPANPDYIYAIIEATKGNEGFYRSTNRGASWEKRSSYKTSGNYYQEIYADLNDPNKVFSMNTWLHHTEDGGKTFKRTGEKDKHVDNHAIWIDPKDANHWLVGCDGGMYETWDHAKNWQFKANLPITQFYKVSVDNDSPFYNVYGGTQDNNSMGGPSRTINNTGIVNSDWYITNGGDGFESQIDPEDPNIVYAQAQYGYLVRYDKQSGERVGIKPQAGKGEAALRWNWDAPLLISPHNHKRLYFAANKLFRSEDRGNSWTAISGDLTQQIDRNKIPVMGKIQSPDAVMKNMSTSIYGNIVAMDESPIQEDLLFVGTDDGLIQYSENAGKSWAKIAAFDGVPKNTYVNMIRCSQHDANTVYAVFNNHKNGDFKPYILKSTDKGKTWNAIQTNLPERGSVYAIAEDHIDAKLLFAGTEFGVFFSNNGGNSWTALKNGLPTIAIRDIAIQERENDLVLASFGRGFYVLDDYSPLRQVNKKILDKEAHIFPIKKALMYVESNPIGLKGKSAQGASYFSSPNPPVGAVFSYYIKDDIKTNKKKRQEAEEKNPDAIDYPSVDELRAEDREEKPFFLFVIKDSEKNTVQKIKTNTGKGIQRIHWDFRYASTTPVRLAPYKPGRYGMPDYGPLALPGTYYVSLYKSINGTLSEMVSDTPFEVEMLHNKTLPADDQKALLAFQQDLSELRRSVRGTNRLKEETDKKIKYLKSAVINVPSVPLKYMEDIKKLEEQTYQIGLKLNGDQTLASRSIESYPSINDRIESVIYGMWNASAAPTETSKQNYNIAKEEYAPVLDDMKNLIVAVKDMEKKLAELPIPYTPGRDENWKKD